MTERISPDVAGSDQLEWLRIVAMGAVVGDCTTAGLVRYAQVSRERAAYAHQAAVDANMLDHAGYPTTSALETLLASVTHQEQAQVHAVAARHFAHLGPDHHSQVLHQARAAGSALVTAELVELLDRTGNLSLSIGAYHDAIQLLSFADEIDVRGEYGASGRRLCSLAAAADGTGRVDLARQYLARAVSLGKLTDDHALVAQAAVQYALPVDWYSGDDRAAGFLQLAGEHPLDAAHEVAVIAAQALVEMRVPLWETDGQQVAWVTRPNVAQPLATTALVRSTGLADDVRLLALLAWRSTHRAPEHLSQRREVSDEAFTLAQRLRHPSFQVEAGVWLAVDAAEAGDRGAYDRAVALVRWIAERDGNPRLRWRALLLWAGQAMLDGDPDAAEAARRDTAALATDAHLPGWVASDLFIAGQLIISSDDPERLIIMTTLGDEPFMQNPIALASVAYAHARVGDPAVAQRMAARAFARLDAESSLLLGATRLAATAAALADHDMARRLVDLLAPHRDHCSVDSHGWWVDGPVDAWMALLHSTLGNHGAAHAHGQQAAETAKAFRDGRALERLAVLQPLVENVDRRRDLTARQLTVLNQVALGFTNREIAEQLNFSVSTIRQTLAGLYDMFGTRSRTSVVAAALASGQLKPGSA